MSSTLTQDYSDSRSTRSPGTAAVVAVSATADSANGSPHRVRLNSAYVTALESAGLVPLIVPPLASEAAAHAILERVDGLLLTGGEDVEPHFYGQPRSSNCGPANEERDRTEIALIQAAQSLRKPVMAICRGIQILNVALGGTLVQDIASEIPNEVGHDAHAGPRDARVHSVKIDEGSRVAEAIGATHITINSLHHQSVLEVAPGLRITARAPDGVVEAVESDSPDWWAIAVQWHPEEMNDSAEPWDRGIFKAFAEELSEG